MAIDDMSAIGQAWAVLKEEKEEEVEEVIEELVEKPCLWCRNGVVETAPSNNAPMCDACADYESGFGSDWHKHR